MKESSIDSQKIIRRKREGELEYLPDDLTIEEPLEIYIGRKALATTMRTPGHDEELAAGFLVSEAIVRARDEIAQISADRDNRVTIDLKGDAKLKLNSMKRFGTISSSCGLCGKTSIDAIRQNFPAITSREIRVDIKTLLTSAMPHCAFPSRVFDQDAAHGLGCRGKKVPSPIPLLRLIARQPQIRFRHQRSWLESVTCLKAGHLRCSQPPQLLINQRQQFCRGLRIAFLSGIENQSEAFHRISGATSYPASGFNANLNALARIGG